eukprot:scaffold30406_cov52-Attheya_sp.AAC.1
MGQDEHEHEHEHAVNDVNVEQCTTRPRPRPSTLTCRPTTGTTIQESLSSSHNNIHREDKRPLHEILETAIDNALLGGIAGAAAMGANVMALMWMRTAVR